mgnify:CR=1 FL=1
MSARGLRAAVVAVLAAAALAACQSKSTAAALPVLPIGGDFELTGDDGRPFTLASQRGKVVLIFFGYSSCPDACPTTLSKLSTAVRKLGDDGKRVRALYVSVDPERDTPEVLKADLANFTLDAVGLTGTKAQIDKVVEQYGASYKIVLTPQSAAKYTISHTTAVFALDTSGRVRSMFPYEASVDEVVSGIRAILSSAS